MARVTQVKIEIDPSGSYPDGVTVYRFDGEPTREQKAECYARGYGMEWASGETVTPVGYREGSNVDFSKVVKMIFLIFIVAFCGVTAVVLLSMY